MAAWHGRCGTYSHYSLSKDQRCTKMRAIAGWWDVGQSEARNIYTARCIVWHACCILSYTLINVKLDFRVCPSVLSRSRYTSSVGCLYFRVKTLSVSAVTQSSFFETTFSIQFPCWFDFHTWPSVVFFYSFLKVKRQQCNDHTCKLTCTVVRVKQRELSPLVLYILPALPPESHLLLLASLRWLLPAASGLPACGQGT